MIMRIAVTYDDTEVYQHFGDTSYFKIYDIEDGEVINSEIVPTGDASHAALVPFLAERGADRHLLYILIIAQMAVYCNGKGVKK